jgi:plastocyanin
MIRVAQVLCVLAAVAAISLGVALVRGQPHMPSPVWVRGAKAESGDWKWADSKRGSVKGKVTFSARRPNQPMVVYLLKVDGDGKTATQGIYDVPAKLVISQKGAKFDPGFAVLVRGQETEFDNDEDKEISHNVYFLGDVELDLGIFEQGQKVTHKFEDYGEVSVHCSIHKRMDARVFVAPNPAYALIEGDADSFDIKGVPAGRYKLLTWQKQKRFKDVDAVVEVKDGAATSVTVEMTR